MYWEKRGQGYVVSDVRLYRSCRVGSTGRSSGLGTASRFCDGGKPRGCRSAVWRGEVGYKDLGIPEEIVRTVRVVQTLQAGSLAGCACL
jgi:hypothetical protein